MTEGWERFAADQKLTESQVREIRATYQRGVKGFGQVALAEKFGVSQALIWRILTGRLWKEVQ